jgi:hypothetical protein
MDGLMKILKNFISEICPRLVRRGFALAVG